MVDEKIVNELNKFLKYDEIKTEEPLSKHTTYKIGGNADYFIMPNKIENVEAAIELAKKNNIPYFVLGRGSNVLASDNGYEGMVIHLGNNFSEIQVDGNRITAEAGASIIAVSNRAANESLTGMEFICGVPGTVGGAVTMNAGCYGGQISDILVSAKILDQVGNVKDVTPEELQMSYRYTNILQKRLVLLSATFELSKGDQDTIKQKMNELNERRRKVQPLDMPNAGSVFKRPGEEIYPGKLVEDAGFKGVKVGGAIVSPMHANFIVNEGGAKAVDVMKLVEEIQDKVKKDTGLDLELELKLLGDIDKNSEMI